MSQSQQWITLDSIIYDYINEAELSANKYAKLFQIAFRGMEQIGLDFFYSVKSVKLIVNANKTVTLPSDYLNYVKLGVLDGNGNISPLKFNNNLTSFSDLQLDRIANIADGISNGYSFSSPNFFNYSNGDGSFGMLYGVPTAGLYSGGFKIDNSNGVIILDSTFAYNDLIMEYVSAPPDDKDYKVPMQFREALLAWVAWRDIVNLPIRRGSIGTTQSRRHEYFEARRKGIAAYKPFYLQQFKMASQDSSRLTVK